MARSSIAASKLELKALEAQLRDLIDKRNARVQILDDFNDLYHLRLGPLMSRILELRKQLAVSMQRKQEAEIKRREKDYQSCLQFISRAVDQLATLKQQWTGLNAASREAVGIRQRIQQQTELITALLAEIRELEADFSHQDDSAFRRRRKMRNRTITSIGSSSRKRNSATPAINVCRQTNAVN